MLSSQTTVTPRFRRAAWTRCEVPMEAASPSPTTIRYFLSGWASLSPVATARARPWVAPKLSPPQVAKVCRPTQPIPVPKMTSSCARPSSSMACRSQFSIIPIPQPWQALVGIWLGRKYFWASLFMGASPWRSPSADSGPDVGQLRNLAGPGDPGEPGHDLGHRVQLGTLPHEVDLPLVGGRPHHLADQLAVIIQLADQVVAVPLEQLVE